MIQRRSTMGVFRSKSSRRGATILEVSISLGILLLVTTVLAASLFFYVSNFRSLHAMSRMQSRVTNLLSVLNKEMDEVGRITRVGVAGQAGDGLAFTYPGRSDTKRLIINEDNHLVLESFNAGTRTASRILAHNIAADGSTPVFNRLSTSGRDAWELVFVLVDQVGGRGAQLAGKTDASVSARFILTPRNSIITAN